MEWIIFFFIGLASGVSIVTLMNNSKKNRSGAKGITGEYTYHGERACRSMLLLLLVCAPSGLLFVCARR